MSDTEDFDRYLKKRIAGGVFKHVISLGFSCGTALSLETFGLHESAMPLDWFISPIEGTYCALKERFAELFNPLYLFQASNHPDHWYHSRYHFWIRHDFSPFCSLKKQLPSLKNKYERRIGRFFKSIEEPTLFVRRVAPKGYNGDCHNETEWWENHYAEFLAFLRTFNYENELLLVVDGGKSSTNCPFYPSYPSNDKEWTKNPLGNSPELVDVFNSFPLESKERNLLFYEKKNNYRFTLTARMHRAVAYMLRPFRRVYIHKQQVIE